MPSLHLASPLPAAYRRLEALRRCRVVLGVLTLLAAGLTASPQATDLLITLGQTSAPLSWAATSLATAWLSLNAWFWARVSLASDGADGDMRRDHPLLPDLCAAAAFWIVAASLWIAAQGVPASMLAEMGAVTSGAQRLRIGAGVLAAGGAAALAAGLLTRRSASRRGPATVMALVSAAVALAGMAAYGSDPVATAAVVPPGAAVLCAASGLICGGTLLARAGSRTRAPLLLLVFLAGATLAVLRDRDVLPDNHDVRRLPGPARSRPDVETAFMSFLDQTAPEGAGPAPVVLVASSGGGVAASYWTATVLGDLADASREFARRIFAISGVSGGALGATEYAAALREPGCPPPGLKRCLQSALSADFLGPVLGALLYSDLFQRFVPFVVFPDRQAALEQAWARRWRAVFHDDRLDGPFLDLWAEGEPWPALLLNGTSLATGGRLVTSNLVLRDGAQERGADLLAAMHAEVRADTAAGNSARFPYISPLGAVREGAHGTRVDAVGDGGYFENLGATTLLDLLDLLAATAREARRDVRFVIVQIVSDPDVGPDGQQLPAGMSAASSSLLPLGLTGPAEMLLETRGARGVYAAAALARRTAALGGVYVPVRLGRSPTGATAPLGWALSAVAREVIDEQWSPACRRSLLEAAGFAEDGTRTSGGATVPAMWQAADCARK